MKAEQAKDFRDKSVIDVNPSPLYIGGVDSYDEYANLPTDGRGCFLLSLVMILIILIIGGYVVFSR